jgi:asparagine synthase (glutamine-hydrolysing)
MCGIAGFVTTAPAPDGDSVLERMTRAIAHRGPDDHTSYHDASAWLGHQRLSIIDLAGGRQPMTSEDKTLWITYNGEIFNHASLRKELERAGHVYASRCDTETILHAYEEYGPDCVSHLRGMFAFAIWDRARRTLFCARDRLGIKPFYYFSNARLFAFASEIKSLLEHPAIPAGLEPAVLGEYLAFGYVSEERTLFSGIRQLMPGHHLTVRQEGGRIELDARQYWDVPEPSHSVGRDDAEWIRECRSRLEETVGMRLMSDVPLGMFLSGGVDSSAIAALMKRMVAGPVKTYAVGYKEAPFSELSHASKVARHLGTEHREVTIGKRDFFDAIPRLVWHEDQPMCWPSSVSLYFVSKLAAEEVKVVLTGEGSDELFGGYERYAWNLLNQRALPVYAALPAAVRKRMRRMVGSSRMLSAGVRRKLGHTVVGRGAAVESLYLDNFYCAFSRDEQRALLDGPEAAVYRNFLRYFNARSDSSPLARMLYADQKTYLVELLKKQDRMSMACSIESRVPFLDHPFVEYAAQVPDGLKIRGRTQKYVLKKAVEDLLPESIVHRKKMGFPTPLRQWLLEPESEPIFAALRDRDGFLASYLDLGQVDTLLDEHVARRHDATDRIWRLLNLQVWGDLFISGKRDRLDMLGTEPAPLRA